MYLPSLFLTMLLRQLPLLYSLIGVSVRPFVSSHAYSVYLTDFCTRVGLLAPDSSRCTDGLNVTVPTKQRYSTNFV